MDFVIEEIPVKANVKYPFREMKVGQSFSFPKEIYIRVTRAASALNARGDSKFSVRKQPDGTYRCGRVA